MKKRNRKKMNEDYLFKLVCENDLVFFLKVMLPVLEPETNYIHNWHVEVIADHLMRVANKDDKYGPDELIENLDVNIPPRTIKSLLVNIIFPCWVWTWWPSAKFISGSHTATLSQSFNMKRRRLIKSELYQRYWPIQLEKDADTQRFFENTSKGFMQAISTGGAITGVGADFLLSDDLISADSAFSKADRDNAVRWYFQEFFNRLIHQNKSRRVNINQRLHEEDISGTINKDHPYFEKLIIPMVKKSDQVQNKTGWVDPRKEGEFIHPARFGEKEKDQYYKAYGAYGWAGQMQQEPAPADGGIIKKEWIRVEDISHLDLSDNLISVDATFKGGKGSDFVAMELWARSQANFVLVDMIRGRWDFPQTLQMLANFYNKHTPRMVLIEDKANGPAIISLVQDKIPGVVPVSPKDSKEARVHQSAHYFESGNVIINKDLANKQIIIDELTMFPNAAHDDTVDAATQAINELAVRGGKLVLEFV